MWTREQSMLFFVGFCDEKLNKSILKIKGFIFQNKRYWQIITNSGIKIIYKIKNKRGENMKIVAVSLEAVYIQYV